jgi:hypothetical protein
LPSRTASGRLGAEVREDDVGDASFQCAERFFGRLALLQFAVVEAAAGRVPMPDLCHRGDVHRVIQLAVAAQ